MQAVPLVGKHAKGRVALVDDADYELVRHYRWYVYERPRGVGRKPLGPYALASARKPDGRRTSVSMHKLITGWPLTDHENGNGLDNQRSNLRPASTAENAHNQQAKGVTSRFKGVYWNARWSKWQASIYPGGKHRSLGYFADEEAAARAYDAAARATYGEYARPNFPD